ncbi:13236_t:CDS:2, partial [Gigaspora margarita]
MLGVKSAAYNKRRFCPTYQILLASNMGFTLINASNNYIDPFWDEFNFGATFSFKISMPIVFLPTSYNYASVYRDYVQAFKDEYGNDVCIIAESMFTNVWKALLLSLQFISPKTDLCETCEMMKMDIQYATQHEKKLELTENYLAHLSRAQKEHNYYNYNIVILTYPNS